MLKHGSITVDSANRIRYKLCALAAELAEKHGTR